MSLTSGARPASFKPVSVVCRPQVRKVLAFICQSLTSQVISYSMT